MIGKLVGIIEEKSTHSVLLNCQGVCYEVEVPISTSFSLPEAGSQASLFTHFVVREDAQLLYGFARRQDRDMFRVLIKVNGVGPKLGITILSGMDSAALSRCVIEDDVATFVKLPGIGKKTAERLLIELRDKVGDYADSLTADTDLLSPVALSAESVKDEAEKALVALGYKAQDAAKVVKNVFEPEKTLEALIKDALKSML